VSGGILEAEERTMSSVCDVCGGNGHLHSVSLPRQGLRDAWACGRCVGKLLHFADRHLPRRLLGDYLAYRRRRRHIEEIVTSRD
jgi:hypothetical protein